jgi:hypothetical protein
MNSVRIWLLRLAAIAAILFGVASLYDSYQDFSWGRLAIAETGGLSSISTTIVGEIATQSEIKNRDGRAAQNAGLLLIGVGLLLEAIAAALKKLTINQSPEAVGLAAEWRAAGTP